MPSQFTLLRPKACQGCYAAKAKCEAGTHGNYTKCKRCTRLQLNCVPKDAAPRKRRRCNVNPESEVGYKSEYARADESSSLVCLSYFQQELARGLDSYRQTFSKYFPFVVIDKYIRSDMFEAKRPFLSLVLSMLGCTKDRARQSVLAAAIRRYIGHHIVVEGEKSLDLLQGLLIVVHWYHFQLDLRKDQRSMFLHLTMAMVVDLGLNNSPRSRRRFNKATDAPVICESDPAGRPDHSLEEKRAFLGCVYLTSVKSKCVTDMDALRFSEYVEECCERLQTDGISSDSHLVHLVRVQQVVEKFELVRHSLLRSYQLRPITPSSLGDQSSSGTTFVEKWESQLAALWDSVPFKERTDLLKVQYLYARVCLHEIVLEDSVYPSEAERLPVLFACLAALRSFYDVFLPISRQHRVLLEFPSHSLPQSNHVSFVAVQLCYVQCEGWSGTMVERELNLTRLVEDTVKSFDEMLIVIPRNEIPEFFIRLEPIGKKFKCWYLSKLSGLKELSHERHLYEKPTSEEHELDLEFMGQFLNLDDDLWLQGILSDDKTSSSLSSS